MRLINVVFALTFAAISPLAAHADPLNSVGGSAGGFSGSGTLVTTSNGDGSYTIVGISGTGVDGLIGAGGFNGNDNQLFPSNSSVLDGSGFSFTDTLGNTDFSVNVAANSGGYSLFLTDSDGFSESLPIDLSVTSTSGPTPGYSSFFHRNNVSSTQDFNFSFDTPTVTPEPSSILLFGTGLIAVAGAFRRSTVK